MKLLMSLGSKIKEVMKTAITDLNDSRVLLIWLYSFFYLILVCYIVKARPTSDDTAISTTGMIVGAVLASYVLGKSHENATTIQAATSDNSDEDTDPNDDDTKAAS